MSSNNFLAKLNCFNIKTLSDITNYTMNATMTKVMKAAKVLNNTAMKFFDKFTSNFITNKKGTLVTNSDFVRKTFGNTTTNSFSNLLSKNVFKK